MEKGWLLQGVPYTKGQAQQLVASSQVPDKVVYMSAKDDVIVKTVAEGEDQMARKKELMASLQVYRRQLAEVVPIFSHISKEFVVDHGHMPSETTEAVLEFLDERRADPGLPMKPPTKA